jgi:hypothetical protein
MGAYNIRGYDAADQQAKLGRNNGKVDIIVRMSTHEIVNKIDEIILLEWQANGMAKIVQTSKSQVLQRNCANGIKLNKICF